MEFLIAAGSIFISQSPIYLVLAVGIVIAMIRWHRHPKLSLLVVITFILMIVCRLISNMVLVSLPVIAERYQMSVISVSSIYGIVSLIPDTILWGLIVWAIFGWRARTDPRPGYYD